MKREHITRKEFLAAGLVTASLIGIGGVGFAARQASATYVRPPGISDNEDFISRCNRCQRCMQVCPYNIISPISLGRNIVGVGTPELNFTLGYCDFCMLCTEVCPTGALRSGTETEKNIGVAKVVHDACVAWDWTGCTVCADECPVEDAIWLDEQGRPVVDDSLCDGCGYCEHVCPSFSLRAYDSSVETKGIIVVSRESGAAHRSGAIDGDTVQQERYRKGSAGS